MSVMKCTAAGDAMIFRQLPGHYEGFEALRDFIAQGELRFLNLETTIHNFETYGAALSGGSWFCAEPRVLDGVKEFGFNMLTTANNHAMDYSHAGLLKTLEYLQAACTSLILGANIVADQYHHRLVSLPKKRWIGI